MEINLIGNSKVAVVENIISEEECKLLSDYCIYIKANNVDIGDISELDEKAASDENIQYWRSKNVFFKFAPDEYKAIASKIHKRYDEIFKQYLISIGMADAEYDPKWLEPIVVHIYQQGDSLDLHQDNHDFAFVFYINSPPEFSGGDLYYPDIDAEITPARNTLVIAPSKDLHEVKEVTSGYRCSMTTFIALD